ncbi:MAG: DUF2911 domain-containing protein [Cytophagales bacterium]|nr:DUF2911 domain-containing protein [Cytophagales bacterium]
MNYIKSKSFFVCLLLLISTFTFAQNLTLPRASQYAEVSQRVGISNVTITYHSPGAKGRNIWGGIIQYGSIWRAGANENTTITFSHDATIEGQSVPAGTYGLFMLPVDKQNVRVILSQFSQSWGTVSPTEAETTAIVDVKTKEIAAEEWLNYSFKDRGGNEVTAVLQWADLEVPFTIGFDVASIVLENAKAELKGPAGFSWRGYSQAANFALQNDVELEQAMAWIDQSINMSKGFTNLQVKAGLLAKAGQEDAAKALMKEAIPMANGFQLNQYGYQLLNGGDTKGAIEVFQMNVKNNAEHRFIWGFTDSLGEAYLKDGNKKLALKYYKQARTLAPENQFAYLDGVIADLESK